MENRTEGAWIINHAKKLQDVTRTTDFEDIELAGKCGLLLSSLAASESESTLNKNKVNAISDSLNISKRLELPIILETLEKSQLIDTSHNGDVSILGITTSGVLTHTSEIFNQSSNDYQKASLDLTNYSSDKPIKEKLLKEYISDTYKLDSKTNFKLFQQSEDIGLIDYEELDKEKTYFNGNLFKRDSIEKTSKVLSSLSSEDARKVSDLDALISKDGCIIIETALTILGSKLLSKLQSIAMYDFNEVSNNNHSKIFLTKPSSFAKFGNPFEDDALDMAKAFISSLIYGLKISSSNRGQIQDYSMLVNTLKKLLRGEKVGPCTAIGEDYQILELNRVIKLEHSYGTRYFMILLKYDIARIALDVIEKGDLAEKSTFGTTISSSSVSNYTGSEENRWKIRRKKSTTSDLNVAELLRTMRK
ncbi:hypothetical protein [Tenacibaculum discolor]|uniref:hypothetical protein n=1 Tax=Tenacibaculum discolor TaxID=361581 RepID=UPI003F7956EE